MYVYTILNSPIRSPLLARFAYQVARQLDVPAMAQAANDLAGTHDFAAFGQPTVGIKTVRTVYDAAWSRTQASYPVGCDPATRELYHFRVEANAFLRGMVRRLVGTLVLVGLGRLTIDGFREILLSKDISRAGAPAPACGLCLWQVRYGRDAE